MRGWWDLFATEETPSCTSGNLSRSPIDRHSQRNSATFEQFVETSGNFKDYLIFDYEFECGILISLHFMFIICREIPAVEGAKPTTDVPIVLGIVLTLSWILVCASIFSYTEVWPFSLSFYFTFLSLTTNNLGEVTPQQINLLVANICIFMGLCLISMTITIVRQNIENRL